MLAVAIRLDLTLAWTPDGRTLQILERPKPPVNRHPRSGVPTFFSSLHSQSAYLQSRRAEATGSATFGGVDVFYGDLSPIEPEVLDEVDAVVRRHVRRVAMRRGDVVLLDSYQALHGRDVFDGAREHGVIWLTHGAEEDADKA